MDEALISGGVIALGAFGLAWGRDEWNRRRDRKSKDRAVLGAVAEEIAANRRTAVNDRELIRTERVLIAGTPPQRLVNPLDPLEMGFWDLVKINLPSVLLIDAATLGHVREVARLAGQVNQMLVSRETYRHTQPAIAVGSGQVDWWTGLASYDELLETFLGELIEGIDRLAPGIDCWRRNA